VANDKGGGKGVRWKGILVVDGKERSGVRGDPDGFRNWRGKTAPCRSTRESKMSPREKTSVRRKKRKKTAKSPLQ